MSVIIVGDKTKIAQKAEKHISHSTCGTKNCMSCLKHEDKDHGSTRTENKSLSTSKPTSRQETNSLPMESSECYLVNHEIPRYKK